MFDQKKNDSVSNIKDLRRLLVELFGPLLPTNTQDFITKPFDFDTYLKKALTFLELISKIQNKDENVKNLIKQIYQCWVPNLGALFAKAINDNQEAFGKLITFIDALNQFTKVLVVGLPEDYLKFLDFNRSLFKAFVELKKMFNTPYLDQIMLTPEYTESLNGFIVSLSKALETATTNPFTSDPTQDVTFKTLVMNCLNGHHEKIKTILIRCIKQDLDLAENIIPLLNKCLALLQKLKRCLASSTQAVSPFLQKSTIKCRIENIKNLMLHYQLLKILALTNNPKYSEELIPIAWQVLAIINKDNPDQSSQTVINKNNPNLIQCEILLNLYIAFVYTSLAKNNWKSARFYLNKASSAGDIILCKTDPNNKLLPTFPVLISAIEKMSTYFTEKKYYKLAIEYQQLLKQQYQREQKNLKTQNHMCSEERSKPSSSTLVPQNAVTSLPPEYFEQEAKKITAKLEALEDSIKANEQNHYQQIKEILSACADKLGFTLKTSDISILLILNFDDKHKLSFFSYKLNHYEIHYEYSSDQNNITVDSHDIQIDKLKGAIKLALQSLTATECQHTEPPAPTVSPGKEEAAQPNTTPVDYFQYSKKTTSSSSLSSSKKKKKKNKECAESPIAPATIPQSQEPKLTVTWQGKTIIPNDAASDYFVVFLETSYFPDHSYIGLLDKKLSNQIPDQWKTFLSTFQSGRIVGPVNQNGVVFCKAQEYPAKIKVTKAAGHTRIYGHFADKATVFRHYPEDDTKEESPLNVIIFDTIKTKKVR